MPGLSIRNIPDGLHRRLKERARRSRRSLNAEVLCLLEQALAPEPEREAWAEQALEATRRVRARMTGPGLDIDEIQAAIEDGRP